MPTNPRILTRLLAAVLLIFLACSCGKKDNKQHFLDAAKGFFDAGEFEKAKAEYLKVLSASPGNTDALAQLGRIWTEQGHPMRAIPFLREMRKLTPDNVELRTKLLTSYASLQFKEDVRREALEILEFEPGNEKALILLSAVAGTPEEIDVVQKRVAAFPARSSAAVQLAKVNLILSGKDRGPTEVTAAERMLLQAVESDPDSVPARSALARLLVARRDTDGAERELKVIAAKAPVRSPERLSLAEFKLGQGQHDEARTLGLESTAGAPDYIPAWIFLARVELEAKKPAAARDCLQKVLNLDSAHFEARLLLGQALLDERQSSEATAVLEKLQTELPNHPLVQFRLASAYVHGGGAEKAMPILTALVAAHPGYVDASLLLASIKLAKGRAEEVSPELRTLLKQLKAENPDAFRVSRLLAASLQMGKQFDEAAVLLEGLRAVVTTGSDLDTSLLLHIGAIQQQAGKPDKAREAYEAVLRTNRGHLPAILQLVNIDLAAAQEKDLEESLKEKRFASALERVRPLMEKSPVPAEGHLLQGLVFSAQKKWDEAESALLKALDAKADYEPAIHMLVKSCVGAKKLDTALKYANDRLNKQPQDRQTILMAAMISEANHDYGQAAKHYEKLLELNPGIPAFMNNLAVIYLNHQNDTEKAFKLAQEARKLRSAADAAASPEELAAITDTLGWIQFKRGEYAEAFSLLREAGGVLGKNPEVNYHLGFAAAMTGDLETAKTALNEALKPETGLPPEFPERAAIQARYDLLNSPLKPLKELESMSSAAPGDPLLLLLLGRARGAEGDFVNAEAAYERALKLSPGLTPAVIELGRLFVGERKNPAKALEIVKRARLLDPTVEQLGALASIALKAGDHAWAHPLLSQYVQSGSGSNDAAAMEDLAWASYYLGRVIEARTYMEKAGQLNPDKDRAARSGAFLKYTGEGNPVQLALEAGKEPKPICDSEPALLLRAAKLYRDGKPVEAAEICTTLLNRIPNFASAQARLAAIYVESPGDRDKARDLAAKARSSLQKDDPDLKLQSELVETIAILSYYEKNYSRALQLLSGIPVQSLRPLGLFSLGMSRCLSGDREKGVAHLNQAIAAGLPDALAAEARAVIEQKDK